jgi:hypothetical protein
MHPTHGVHQGGEILRHFAWFIVHTKAFLRNNTDRQDL